jgi:hypothetical protein
MNTVSLFMGNQSTKYKALFYENNPSQAQRADAEREHLCYIMTVSSSSISSVISWTFSAYPYLLSTTSESRPASSSAQPCVSVESSRSSSSLPSLYWWYCAPSHSASSLCWIHIFLCLPVPPKSWPNALPYRICASCHLRLSSSRRHPHVYATTISFAMTSNASRNNLLLFFTRQPF